MWMIPQSVSVAICNAILFSKVQKLQVTSRLPMPVIFSNSQIKNIGNNYEQFSMGSILGQAI
jgi:hypothetical protein